MYWSRGTWRGRGRGMSVGSGRGRGGISATSIKPAPVPVPSREPPIGPLLFSLRNTDFDHDAKEYEGHAAISDCKALASYNWLDRADPTIIMPGKPAKWTPLEVSRQLALDDGEYLRDQNSANFPQHPLEPAVIAALATNSELTRKSNVVCCNNSLHNLLRFIGGEDKNFRILVELVGNTVFFTRRENTPRELIPDVKGYGFSFPKTYTTWDPVVQNSTSYQRVLSYRFGCLRFLLRFECDGYIAVEEREDNLVCQDVDKDLRLGTCKDTDELLAKLGCGSEGSIPSRHGTRSLKIIPGGSLIKQDRVFDLKTRSIKRKQGDAFENTFGEQLPRLWVAQIAKFILAYHTRGTFDDISVRDAQQDVKAWEQDHVKDLSRLAALIHHIRALTIARSDRKLELRYNMPGMLEVRGQLEDAGEALSEQITKLWSVEQDTADGVSSDSQEDSILTPDVDPFDQQWEDEPELDYTACSSAGCGYCGRCSY